jgi:hypothetical protein
MPTICFLCLDQHNAPVSNSTLLDLLFSNIRDLIVPISNYSVVNRDSYFPPLVPYCQLTFKCLHISPVSHHNSTQGDYFLLFRHLRPAGQVHLTCRLTQAVCTLASRGTGTTNLTIPSVKRLNLKTSVFSDITFRSLSPL